jgi:hypothetical protein
LSGRPIDLPKFTVDFVSIIVTPFVKTVFRCI